MIDDGQKSPLSSFSSGGPGSWIQVGREVMVGMGRGGGGGTKASLSPSRWSQFS